MYTGSTHLRFMTLLEAVDKIPVSYVLYGKSAHKTLEPDEASKQTIKDTIREYIASVEQMCVECDSTAESTISDVPGYASMKLEDYAEDEGITIPHLSYEVTIRTPMPKKITCYCENYKELVAKITKHMNLQGRNNRYFGPTDSPGVDMKLVIFEDENRIEFFVGPFVCDWSDRSFRIGNIEELLSELQ